MFNKFKGKIITEIYKYEDCGTHLFFFCKDGSVFIQYHPLQCCEDVYLDDICGNLEDLINVPILLSEEVINEYDDDDYCTWSFYKLQTIKGDVTFRWYGTSNGYYSERVDTLFYSTFKDFRKNYCEKCFNSSSMILLAGTDKGIL